LPKTYFDRHSFSEGGLKKCRKIIISFLNFIKYLTLFYLFCSDEPMLLIMTSNFNKASGIHLTQNRRYFLKSSLISTISLLIFPFNSNFGRSGFVFTVQDQTDYHLTLDVPTRLFDGQHCWCHPRAGIVPERGARLGNFGVTEVSRDETWVTVSEWMQPEGVEKYGSDGSVFVARIHWKRPNKLFK